MKKIILKESELIKLVETAMDLDIYSQQSTMDTNNGNLDAEDSIEEIITRLKELLSMLKSGKKVSSNLKTKIYRNLDDINNTYSEIKYKY